MAGKFEFRHFSNIDLNDTFFDSLKKDYPGTASSTGFVEWFQKKASENKQALVFSDEKGLGAFICLKRESEAIRLSESLLPAEERIKISTLRIAERYRGQRLGEGAIGLVLWMWQQSKCKEIYVTVFQEHQDLITQLEKFGFIMIGYNLNRECVYIKSREKIDYSDPYKAFPFINPNFEKTGYLIIKDEYHDLLFPYSELKNVHNSSESFLDVSNGISKVYLGSPYTTPPYQKGDPVLIYRQFTGEGQKRYKSCLTTYCVVKNIITINRAGKHMISYGDFIKIVGNKSVFSDDELQQKYYTLKNLTAIELVYYGYFGEGNNVNMDWLDNNGCWGKGYPTETILNREQFKSILRKGKVDVDDVVIN